MDLLSFLLGFFVCLWAVLQILYPEQSKWFHSKWVNYLEKRLLITSLFYLLFGSVFLLIVWLTNNFLILLVIGSFMLYTGVKYLLFGRRVVELSKKSLNCSPNKWRLMGFWMLLGGIALIYISTWF